jgi:putative hydrolase of the HAD superfamily
MHEGRSTRGNKTKLRAVVFDYGNVLCHPQELSDVEGMAAICGLAVPRFQELYWKFRMPYDRADLNDDTYWNSVAREAGIAINRRQIEQLVPLDAKGWSRPNHATVQWVEQLRDAGLSLAILSNMPFGVSRYLMANCEWFSFFHHLIFSCDVGRVKPEPEIYENCLEKLDAAPAEVLFLDDIARNVEGATSLGIHGLLFDTFENTVSRVGERFDLPVPLADTRRL